MFKKFQITIWAGVTGDTAIDPFSNNCEIRIYKIVHQKKICRILNINTYHLCSYSSSGNGKITKANDIELIDMTPQTILETDKTFEAENQANFEGRTVRYDELFNSDVVFLFVAKRRYRANFL